MTYAVRPPGRAAYVRVGVVLLLALAGLVGVGAAPSRAGSSATQATTGSAGQSAVRSTMGQTPVRSTARMVDGVSPEVLPLGARTVGEASPSPSPTGQGVASGTPSGTSPRLVVYGLALLTGLLAILALARRGRPPRGRGPQQ